MGVYTEEFRAKNCACTIVLAPCVRKKKLGVPGIYMIDSAATVGAQASSSHSGPELFLLV
jgi:hypothetical protein